MAAQSPKKSGNCLEFEGILASAGDIVQLGQGAADGATTTAKNRGGEWRVHRVNNLDGQAAALLAHNLECGSCLRRRKRFSCNRRAHKLPTWILFRSTTDNSEYFGSINRPNCSVQQSL
jgi:hypothetical protein